MKCRFKTNKVLPAVNETNHTVTTVEGKVTHKKLASNPQKLKPSNKSEETRNPTNRCRRCGKCCNDSFCETHKRFMEERTSKIYRTNEASTSHSFPKLRLMEREENIVNTITTDSQTTDAEESTFTGDPIPRRTRSRK